MASVEERRHNALARNPALFEQYLRWRKRFETGREEPGPSEIAAEEGLSRQQLHRIVQATEELIHEELGQEALTAAIDHPGRAAQTALRAAKRRWGR